MDVMLEESSSSSLGQLVSDSDPEVVVLEGNGGFGLAVNIVGVEEEDPLEAAASEAGLCSGAVDDPVAALFRVVVGDEVGMMAYPPRRTMSSGNLGLRTHSRVVHQAGSGLPSEDITLAHCSLAPVYLCCADVVNLEAPRTGASSCTSSVWLASTVAVAVAGSASGSG